MGGIQGLGGIPEPKSDRPAKLREDKTKDVALKSSAKDDVTISSEAQAAAQLAHSINVAKQLPDVRMERVASAKERLDRGEYKNPDVVAKVAQKISKYLP
jgi:anti-sigma28 factor (negative regulator of flagellin synthesis)